MERTNGVLAGVLLGLNGRYRAVAKTSPDTTSAKADAVTAPPRAARCVTVNGA